MFFLTKIRELVFGLVMLISFFQMLVHEPFEMLCNFLESEPTERHRACPF